VEKPDIKGTIHQSRTGGTSFITFKFDDVKSLNEYCDQLQTDYDQQQRELDKYKQEYRVFRDTAKMNLEEVFRLQKELEQAEAREVGLREALEKIAYWVMRSLSKETYKNCIDYAETYYLAEQEIQEAMRIAKQALQPSSGERILRVVEVARELFKLNNDLQSEKNFGDKLKDLQQALNELGGGGE
jgi:predicted nuclease with TOPRIM domain